MVSTMGAREYYNTFVLIHVMRITILSLIAAAFVFQGFTAPGPNVAKNPQGNSAVFYELDGHYWTVYLVATLLKDTNALQLAYYAELPDVVMDSLGNPVRSTNTWLKKSWQARVHALTGGDPAVERVCSADWVRNATTPETKGQALHRLGDSFAHARKGDKKMFPLIIGHAFAGHKPDQVKNDTAKYMNYVLTLIDALGGKPETTDLTAFKYICTKQLASAANVEVLKSEVYIQKRGFSYSIQNAQAKAVEDYLNMRKDKAGFTFKITAGNKKTPATVTLTFN